MRYTDGPDGSRKGRRPEGIPAENVETELIEVLEPSVSHNGALAVGLECSVRENGSASLPSQAQTVEVFTVENEVVNNGKGRRNKTMCKEVTSSEHEQRERDANRPVHVREIGRRGDNQSQSDSSSSSSDESGGRRSPDRRSPEELGGRGLTELSGRGISELGRHRVSEKRGSPTELGRPGSSEYRQSLEDLRAEFSEELRAHQTMFFKARAEFGEMFGELRAQLVDREAVVVDTVVDFF